MSRLLLVLLILLTVPCAVYAQPAGEFGTHKFSGSVEALPKEYQKGEVFQGWPDWQPSIDWMALPDWMGGDWAASDYRIVKSYDHSTGALHTLPRGTHAPYKCHFGDLRDAQGTMWSALIIPDSQTFPLGTYSDCQCTVKIKPLEIQEQGVVLFEKVLHAIFDSATGVIHDTYTEERVTEITPSGNMMLMANSTNQFYDASGSPSQTTNGQRILKRVSQFKPTLNRNGMNLGVGLSEHLQMIGRTDLIPGNGE